MLPSNPFPASNPMYNTIAANMDGEVMTQDVSADDSGVISEVRWGTPNDYMVIWSIGKAIEPLPAIIEEREQINKKYEAALDAIEEKNELLQYERDNAWSDDLENIDQWEEQKNAQPLQAQPVPTVTPTIIPVP